MAVTAGELEARIRAAALKHGVLTPQFKEALFAIRVAIYAKKKMNSLADHTKWLRVQYLSQKEQELVVIFGCAHDVCRMVHEDIPCADAVDGSLKHKGF